MGYLQTIVFILIIAILVQLLENFLKKFIPALYKSLGGHQGDGQPLKALGGDSLLHSTAHTGEQHHGHQETDARAGGADDGLNEIIAVVQVQNGHTQNGAVSRNQRQIDA